MAKDKDIVYLIGDFRRATVFVGEGLFYSSSEKYADFEKPVHDVEFRGKTYRFWNAEPRFHKALSERPNTHVFDGNLNGVLLRIKNDGSIETQHIPGLERDL